MSSSKKTESLLLFAAVILLLVGNRNARAQYELRPVPAPLAPWQTDINRFESELQKLVTTSQVPKQKALEKRLEENLVS